MQPLLRFHYYILPPPWRWVPVTRLQCHDNQHPWCAAQRHFPLGFWIWQSRDRYETSPGWNGPTFIVIYCGPKVWLVVWTPLKNISQLGWLFPIYGKIKNVPNHHSLWLIVTACAINLQTWSCCIVKYCQIIVPDQIMTCKLQSMIQNGLSEIEVPLRSISH